uniref:CWH43-like N-terminal domain-containing protein n=1 Tax=Chromera velia CCMP2878 TaxID=1169474 RepID=A0A0G4IA53_9ALVE|eukprot:Cvel_12346.t1-p1 / transcript=Cvel_12346.t1 / gene=Cvel_12346 / organism=Chromera_velia_CCMP2878 / gene_product=hypothetical protein / transcript_product=hypothetical protein / location=Cvel_scaffold803:30345-31806(+) / protein_length=294 / sequence_SO=supercontig / SO=protein_coding / is_pseudo=false
MLQRSSILALFLVSSIATALFCYSISISNGTIDFEPGRSFYISDAIAHEPASHLGVFGIVLASTCWFVCTFIHCQMAETAIAAREAQVKPTSTSPSPTSKDTKVVNQKAGGGPAERLVLDESASERAESYVFGWLLTFRLPRNVGDCETVYGLVELSLLLALISSIGVAGVLAVPLTLSRVGHFLFCSVLFAGNITYMIIHTLKVDCMLLAHLPWLHSFRWSLCMVTLVGALVVAPLELSNMQQSASITELVVIGSFATWAGSMMPLFREADKQNRFLPRLCALAEWCTSGMVR